MRSETNRTHLLLLLLLLMAGCGGGGGGGETSGSPVAAAAPTQAPTQAPTAGSPAVNTTCGLPDFNASALARVNQYRAAGASCGSSGTFGPAAALGWNTLLTQASAGHSLDMAANDYFSHTSADGRTMQARIDSTGYRWSALGENIAAGYATVNTVVDGWMASPGHCANLMNPAFTEFGLACAPRSASGGYSTYWTMDLAAPR